MEGEAYVDSIPDLQALEGSLGRFAAELLQNLRVAAQEIRRKTAELEERSRQCELQVVRLEIEYYDADDEDRGYISHRIEEAKEKLHNIHHWQKQVQEHRNVYDRYSNQIKEVAGKDLPKACTFLRRKIDELNDYIGYQMSYPATFIGAGGPPMNAETGTASSRVSPFPECSGFEQSHLMSNDDVKAFLRERIPREHRLSTNVFHISYNDVYCHEGNMNTAGASLPLSDYGPMAIYVYRQSPRGNQNRDSMEWVIAHEIGHAVYKYVLDRGTRSKWNKISSQNILKVDDDSGKYGCINEAYAVDDPIEDFAESYACYIKFPEDLYDTNTQKYELLGNMVFDGRDYRCPPLLSRK